jgi:hypothetical protein
MRCGEKTTRTKHHHHTTMKKTTLLYITLLFTIPTTAQNIPKEKIMHYEVVMVMLDTASDCIYSISIGCDTLALAFRKAMTFFPELCGVDIRLQYGNIRTSMAAPPRILSVFNRRHNRTYRMIVNGNPEREQTQLLYAIPFNAKVGIMGHELAHILDYASRSGLQLTWMGIRYSGKKYRREFERQTDLATIERGLGWQLYHFSYFLAYQADIDEEYRQYKLDIYMKPEEILEMIQTPPLNTIPQ